MFPDPEILHDMWIQCINISTIAIKMSQDKCISINYYIYHAIGLFFCHNKKVEINCCFISL